MFCSWGHVLFSLLNEILSWLLVSKLLVPLLGAIDSGPMMRHIMAQRAHGEGSLTHHRKQKEKVLGIR